MEWCDSLPLSYACIDNGFFNNPLWSPNPMSNLKTMSVIKVSGYQYCLNNYPTHQFDLSLSILHLILRIILQINPSLILYLALLTYSPFDPQTSFTYSPFNADLFSMRSIKLMGHWNISILINNSWGCNLCNNILYNHRLELLSSWPIKHVFYSTRGAWLHLAMWHLATRGTHKLTKCDKTYYLPDNNLNKTMVKTFQTIFKILTTSSTRSSTNSKTSTSCFTKHETTYYMQDYSQWTRIFWR